MDPDHLRDLFADFGPITIKRMFSGYGLSIDGVNFAMSLKTGIIFRVDDATVHRYDAEGAKPFTYSTRARNVVVQSYRVLPERLYDDPEELAIWAREALGAAQRAALKKKRKSAKAKMTPSASRERKAASASDAGDANRSGRRLGAKGLAKKVLLKKKTAAKRPEKRKR